MQTTIVPRDAINRLVHLDLRDAEPACRAYPGSWLNYLLESPRYLLVCGGHAAIEVHTIQSVYRSVSAGTS